MNQMHARMRRSFLNCLISPPSTVAICSKKPLPDTIENYVDLHFHFYLSGLIRKAMGREIPLPNCHALRCFQADDIIKDFMDKDFPKKTDDCYKRMQPAVSSCPCTQPLVGSQRTRHLSKSR